MITTRPRDRLLREWHCAIAALAVLCGSIPYAATAQAAPGTQAPGDDVIMVTATGQAEIPPDYAVIEFGVHVEGDTPVEAAAEMDRRITAVADTLARLGLPRDSLPTSGFSIRPDQRYSEGDRRIVGYVAVSSVRVVVDDMERLPELVGAVLTAGATTVGQLSFHSSQSQAARDRALERAVEAARSDARRLAAAAGVELGRIVEIRSGQTVQRDRPQIALSAIRIENLPPPSGPITPRTITVTATVTIRWRIRSQRP